MSMKDYETIKVIGKGTFGRAILVKKKTTGEQLIIKHVAMGQLSQKEKKEALNEVNVLRQLKHPHIIGYRKSFEEDGNLCIVMDFAENGDLYQLIRNRKGKLFSEETIMKWFVQIASALEYTHSKHILHRDLKTQNIFLSKDNNVLVGDFGIAKILQNTMECAHTLVGTPYYLSPELCREEPYNQKSDVWSLGCILYELATHRHAFEANSMKGLVGKILRGIYPAISSQYSQSLRNIVEICLQKDARKRPSIIELLQMNYVKKFSAKYSLAEQQEDKEVPIPNERPSSQISKEKPSSSSPPTKNIVSPPVEKKPQSVDKNPTRFSKYHEDKASEIKSRMINKMKQEQQQKENELALIEEKKRKNQEYMEEKRRQMIAERELARQKAAQEMERLENERRKLEENRKQHMKNRELELLEAEAERRRIWEENRMAAMRNKQRLHDQMYGISETNSQEEVSPAPKPQQFSAFPQSDDREEIRKKPSTQMNEDQLADFRKQQFWEDKMQAKRNRERILAQMNGEFISEPVEPAPTRKVTPKVAWDSISENKQQEDISHRAREVRNAYQKENEARELYQRELYQKELELREKYQKEKELLSREKEKEQRRIREEEFRKQQIERERQEQKYVSNDIEGLCFRIESLRLFLEKAVGLDAFVKCYELLRNQEESDDDDALNDQLVKILGTNNLGHISQIHQLIVCEDTFNESQI